MKNPVKCSKACSVCSCKLGTKTAEAQNHLPKDESLIRRESVPHLKTNNSLLKPLAKFWNILFQAFVTWVSGLPLEGQKPLIRSTPTIEMCKTLLMITVGASSTCALLTTWPIQLGESNHLTTFALNTAWIFSMMISWLLTVSGARGAVISICHYAVHYTVFQTREWNKWLVNTISVILLSQPFETYSSDHIGKHHPWKTLCSPEDSDAYLVTRIIGIEPGKASVSEYWKHLIIQLINPILHWKFLKARLVVNLSDKETPIKHRISAICFHGSLVSLLVVISMSLNTLYPLLLWLGAWVFPTTILYNCSLIMLQAGLHGWLAERKAGESLGEWQDRVVWNRHPISMFPKSNGGRILWFLELLTLRLFERLFCLPAGLTTHGTHHKQAHDKDWPNEVYNSAEKIRAGRLRIRSFPGIIPSMNYVFAQLQQMDSLDLEYSLGNDDTFERALRKSMLTL